MATEEVPEGIYTGFSLWGIFQIIRKRVSANAAVLSAVLISSLMFSMNWSIWAGMWNPYVVVLPVFCNFSGGCVRTMDSCDR